MPAQHQILVRRRAARETGRHPLEKRKSFVVCLAQNGCNWLKFPGHVLVCSPYMFRHFPINFPNYFHHFPHFPMVFLSFCPRLGPLWDPLGKPPPGRRCALFHGSELGVAVPDITGETPEVKHGEWMLNGKAMSYHNKM